MNLNVAIKFTNKHSELQDVKAEASVMRELAGSPYFPFFYGVYDIKHIIMEYVGGHSLRELLSDTYTVNHWREICMDLTRGLSVLHDKNILHNDLHPGNIMIRNLRYVRIIDFGKATLISDPVTYNIKLGSKTQERLQQVSSSWI